MIPIPKTRALVFLAIAPFAFSGETRPESLVLGRVERVEYSTTSIDLATVRVERVFYGSQDVAGNVFIAVTADQRPDWEKRQTIIPKLRVNEVGIWVIKSTPSGELFSISYAIHGKLWPSIEGRDPDFEVLEKWAVSFGGTYSARDVPGLESALGSGDGARRAFSPEEQVAKLREKMRAEAEAKKTNPSQISLRPWWLIAGIVLAGLIVAILTTKVLRR